MHGGFKDGGDIANSVVFVCAPRVGYVAGAIVSMDGAATPMVV